MKKLWKILVCLFVGHDWSERQMADASVLPLVWTKYRDCDRCERHEVHRTFPVYRSGWFET